MPCHWSNIKISEHGEECRTVYTIRNAQDIEYKRMTTREQSFFNLWGLLRYLLVSSSVHASHLGRTATTSYRKPYTNTVWDVFFPWLFRHISHTKKCLQTYSKHGNVWSKHKQVIVIHVCSDTVSFAWCMRSIHDCSCTNSGKRAYVISVATRCYCAHALTFFFQQCSICWNARHVHDVIARGCPTRPNRQTRWSSTRV